MVAEESGRSIGTVYRYFPDRVSILDRVWPNRDDHLGEHFALDEANGLQESVDPRGVDSLAKHE